MNSVEINSEGSEIAEDENEQEQEIGEEQEDEIMNDICDHSQKS